MLKIFKDPWTWVGIFIPGLIFSAYLASNRSEAKDIQLSKEDIAYLESLDLAHTLGADSSEIAIIDIFDYSCPSCAVVHQHLSPVFDDLVYRGKARHTTINLPLDNQSYFSAETWTLLNTCGSQWIWALKDEILTNQNAWSSPTNLDEKLNSWISKEVTCSPPSYSDRAIATAQATLAEGTRFLKERGIVRVPLLWINGKVVRISSDSDLKKLENSLLDLGE
jgi:hypothetical protein